MEHFGMSAQAFSRATDDPQTEAHELRRTIDHICRELKRAGGDVPAEGSFVGAPTEKHVRQIMRARRARGRFFDSSLFADPAWDMLLELFASGLSGRRVSVTGVSAASAVPGTTALRWISSLEQHGLITRQEDPLDRRRYYLSLSPEAHSTMVDLFAEAALTSTPLI